MLNDMHWTGWLAIFVIAATIVHGLWRRDPTKTAGAPMVDPTKKALPPELQPMAGSTSETVSPELRAVLMELVAHAVRTNALHQHWNLDGLQANGFPLGSYRVTIEKTA